jgi:hypothetical protein
MTFPVKQSQRQAGKRAASHGQSQMRQGFQALDKQVPHRAWRPVRNDIRQKGAAVAGIEASCIGLRWESPALHATPLPQDDKAKSKSKATDRSVRPTRSKSKSKSRPVSAEARRQGRGTRGYAILAAIRKRSRDGEIGRRSGLKIRRSERTVGVRFPLPAPSPTHSRAVS